MLKLDLPMVLLLLLPLFECLIMNKWNDSVVFLHSNFIHLAAALVLQYQWSHKNQIGLTKRSRDDRRWDHWWDDNESLAIYELFAESFYHVIYLYVIPRIFSVKEWHHWTMNYKLTYFSIRGKFLWYGSYWIVLNVD